MFFVFYYQTVDPDIIDFKNGWNRKTEPCLWQGSRGPVVFPLTQT